MDGRYWVLFPSVYYYGHILCLKLFIRMAKTVYDTQMHKSFLFQGIDLRPVMKQIVLSYVRYFLLQDATSAPHGIIDLVDCVSVKVSCFTLTIPSTVFYCSNLNRLFSLLRRRRTRRMR